MTKKHSYEFVKGIIESEEGYKLLSEIYKNAHSKLKIQCKNGHYFEMSFNSFQNGQRCRLCANKIRAEKLKHSFDFVKNFIEKEEGYKLLSETYKNARSKLEMKCKEGHLFEMTFGHFKSERRCRLCVTKIRAEKQRHSFDFVKNFIEKEEGYKLLSETYKNARSKLEMKCSKGHEFPMSFNSFKNAKQRCPYCNEHRNEKKCREIFERLTGYKFPKIRPKWMRNPKTNYPLELDGYCKELKITFEYDGIQHFEKVEFFNKNTTLEEIQFRDRLKDKLCIENGVKLLRIKYDVKDKEDLIRNFLEENNIEIEIKKELKNNSVIIFKEKEEKFENDKLFFTWVNYYKKYKIIV